MFVYERESDNALVIAAGVLPEWAAATEGVKVERFPTEFGVLSYTLHTDDSRTVLDLHAEFDPRPSGIIYQSGDPWPIRAVRVDDRPVDSFSDHEVTLPPASARVVIEYREGPS
jgi:hypothetical protein